MFKVVSCKIEDNYGRRTEVFACPSAWIVGGVIYWPPPEKKRNPNYQCKNWLKYKRDESWMQYTKFKILEDEGNKSFGK